MPLPIGFDPEKGTFSSIKPIIELPRNTVAYNPTSGWIGYNKISIWSRFNNWVTRVGNWFAEHIDSAISIGCILLIAVVVILALIYVISVWNSDGFWLAALAALGCYIGGYICIGLGWYAIIIVTNVLMYGFRLIFWNAWTLIVSFCIIGVIIISLPCANELSGHQENAKQVIEAVSPQNQRYKCIANVLNIRRSPNTYSDVIGVLNKGQYVEVYEVSNGFGCINYRGETGYVSMKYLSH